MNRLPTFFERKEIVIPGDLLAEGNYSAGENTFSEDNKIFAVRIGLVEYDNHKVRVVALKAFYMPQIGDTILGTVTNIGISGWSVNINAPNLALLRASDVLDRPFRPQKDDLKSIFDIGEILIAKVVSCDRTRGPLLTVREPGLGKIKKGQLVQVTPTKIPRVIGKKGSMISMIKAETGCRILLGQNGIILVNGKSVDDEKLAVMALQKIERESHTSGLTDRVAEFLKKRKDENV